MKSLFYLLAVLSFASACVDTSPVLSTQLDHVSSGALITCDPYPPQGNATSEAHTCLVIANPLRPLLRVFDVTQGQFLLSPLGYSPLAVRVEGLTTQLLPFESAERSSVFALDANSSKITQTKARNSKDGVPSFSARTPLPQLILPVRPQQVYLASYSREDQFLVFQGDGSFQLASFSSSQIKPLDVAAGSLVDVAYDASSGVIARLIAVGGKNRIIIQKLGKDRESMGPLSVSVEDVGQARIALGQFSTEDKASLHLLIMRQDVSKLRLLRLDSDLMQVDFDNEISLSSSVARAYFPTGNRRETCCNGTKEWLSVGSDAGLIYYLTAKDLESKEKDKNFAASFDVGKASGLGEKSEKISGLVQILGGDIKIQGEQKTERNGTTCTRQMFFLYASGFVASVCEGDTAGVTRIVTR